MEPLDSDPPFFFPFPGPTDAEAERRDETG